MLNSALIEIIKSFSKDDLKKFHDFVNSPYHNKQTPVIKLYEHIRRHAPSFTSTKLIRNNLWKLVFPGKEFNYGVMKNLIYDLTKLVEDFIAISDNKKNDLRNNLSVMKFLNEHNKSRLLEKYIDKAEKKINQSENPDAEFYRLRFEIERMKNLAVYSKLSDDHKLKSGSEFENGNMFLAESSLISLLEHYVMMNNINKIHKLGISMPLMDEMMNFLKNNSAYLENFFINIYYRILLLDREQKEEYYFMLKKILTGLNDSHSTSLKYAIWVNIYNYIAFRFHSGEINLLKELFELNKLSLEKKIYGEQGEEHFFMTAFTTYLNIALSLKEFEWSEDFVKKYFKKLNKEAQEDIYNYSFAHINSHKENYSGANEYLSKVKRLHEPNMKYGLKITTLIVYYELGWIEASVNVAEAFKRLLDNEKNIQEVIKEKYRKFIKAFLLLIELKNGGGSGWKDKFVNYVSQTKGITSLNWLLRKAKELDVGIDFQKRNSKL